MPKTDPEIITLGAVGTATVTAPSTLDGATVQSIEGGTVTRAGSALAGGETLYAGETLTFTPATAGGTTYLNVRVDNAEFSGHYDDLDGKPDGTGATGPAGRGIASIIVSGGHLTGTYSDGTSWDAGALPVGSGGGLDAEAVQDIVGQMLGDLAMRIEVGRLLVQRAALALDAGSHAKAEISMAKVQVANVLHDAADRAIQINGARGYSRDTVLEWIYRYARQARLVDGADDVHRMVMTRELRAKGRDFWHWPVAGTAAPEEPRA